MSTHRSWSDLSTTQHRMVYLAGAIEALLTTRAARDLARRPASAVRGPRLAWALSLVVQPVGPIAYLALGRRPR